MRRHFAAVFNNVNIIEREWSVTCSLLTVLVESPWWGLGKTRRSDTRDGQHVTSVTDWSRTGHGLVTAMSRDHHGNYQLPLSIIHCYIVINQWRTFICCLYFIPATPATDLLGLKRSSGTDLLFNSWSFRHRPVTDLIEFAVTVDNYHSAIEPYFARAPPSGITVTDFLPRTSWSHRSRVNPRTYKQSHTPTVVQGRGGVDGTPPLDLCCVSIF